eukprot:8249034-Pyramimonas_sp.AAC.1
MPSNCLLNLPDPLAVLVADACDAVTSEAVRDGVGYHRPRRRAREARGPRRGRFLPGGLRDPVARFISTAAVPLLGTEIRISMCSRAGHRRRRGNAVGCPRP